MVTTNKRPLKVFLCHAHADRDAVRALYTRLTNDGVDAWLDKEKLLPGQDWELEIKKAVREADVVVVCLSKQFNQAGFRQKEVRLALDTAMEKPEGEIFIIPARLEESDNLESLKKWHWVDLFEEDGYKMLIRALQSRAHKIGSTLQILRVNTKKTHSKLDKPHLRIMVTGGRVVSKVVEEISTIVGYQVVIRGHVLMSNGNWGVDTFAAEGAAIACKEKFLFVHDQIQVFRPKEGSIPDFDFGTLNIVGQTYDQRRDYVVANSDAVIVLGGGSGTRSIAEYALAIGKPLIPIGVGDTSEAAVEIWKDMFSNSYRKIGQDDLKKLKVTHDNERTALNAVILAENLAIK